MPMPIYLLLASILAAVGQILFKTGAQGRLVWVEFINPALIAGLVCYGLSTLLWIYCLSRLPLRVVYPYTALTFVLVYLGAFLAFGERPGGRGLLGVALVLVGLFLINGEMPNPAASATSSQRAAGPG